MEKACKICGITKKIEEFGLNSECAGGRNPRCKVCVNNIQREKWEKNKQANAAKRAERRKKNLEAYRKRESAYRKTYREQNKEEINRKYREYMRKYRKERPAFRIQKYISYVIKYSMDSKCSTHDIFEKLGYTVEDLMRHIESKFKEGMSWENYGEWHIDHITPQSWLQFTSMEDENFIKCWSLDNLQPLWAKDNISKSDRYSGSPDNIIAFLSH